MMTSGFVPFPNEILDTLMPQLSANGWKVFCFIWRKTAGWNKTSDHISYSQISDATGIKGKATIRNAIKEIGKFVSIDTATGRGNSCQFDITSIINGSEIEPFNDNNGSEIEPNNQENKINGSVFDLNGSEIEHTTYTNTTNNTNVVAGEMPAPEKNGNGKPKPKTELSDTFIDASGIQMPKRKTDVKFWWSSIGELYQICNQDIEIGKKLISYTVQKMRDDNLTISNPNSILNTARAVMAQRAAQKFKTTQPTTAKITTNGGAYV